MSSFVVSDKHLSAICSFAGRMKGFSSLPPHKELFRVLMQANLLAVSERYGDPVEKAVAKVDLVSVPAISVVKLCHCLEYQSSDWSGWEASDAKRYLDWIERAAVNAIPGYEEANWASV